MKTTNVLNELKELSVDSLNIEIKKYLEKYSFSTIDIILSRRNILSLELEDLYEKIVINKRGGYCFEHNKLFHYSLLEKKFEVNKQLARVIYGKDIDAPRTHRINIVTVEGNDYLADVGFGAHTPNALIPMNGEEVKCPNGSIYRIVENRNGLFILEVLREEGFFAFYNFDMGTYHESDFNLSSYFSNTHPKSKHANNLVMSINKTDKTLVILNNTFSIFTDKSRRDEQIDSSKELQSILQDNFYIEISNDEADYLFQKK